MDIDSGPLIKSIRLRNLLSFGADAHEIEFGRLNILIGPNSSGKSNLIEAFSLLQAASKDLTAPMTAGGGGVREWLWKGGNSNPVAEIDVSLQTNFSIPFRYRLAFTMSHQRFELVDEVLENECPIGDASDVYFYYRFQHGNPVLNVTQDAVSSSRRLGESPTRERFLKREDLDLNQSVFSQRKDPEQYPELTLVGYRFSQMHLYREWDIGRYTAPRLPQSADLPDHFLLDDAKNLGLVLNNLNNRPTVKRTLIERLRVFYPAAEEIVTAIHGGTVQVFVHEKGLKDPIPATRLSDGTLRYLCLLSILCHPELPPVICIEEPELGLHPDALAALAELLVEASKRSQIFVTTHSETLVNHFSEMPDSVLVCEKETSGTKIRRLQADALQDWLTKYSLGELWRMGEIGGNL